MDANELRIGNWVDLGGGRNLYQISDEIYGGLNLNPIPLTEKWLTNFGFEKAGGDYRIMLNTPDKYFYAMISKNGIFPCIEQLGEMSHEPTGIVHLNKIESVHQLQNLYFALTGKDLQLA